ncbi:hypothetical protein ACFXKJ_18070 [Kitasatospora indigofera]
MPRTPFVTTGSPGQARATVRARAIVAVAGRALSTSGRPGCTVRAAA